MCFVIDVDSYRLSIYILICKINILLLDMFIYLCYNVLYVFFLVFKFFKYLCICKIINFLFLFDDLFFIGYFF